MIDVDYTFGTIDMYCDIDGCNYSQQFEGFDGHPDYAGATKEARECGWKIYKENKEWWHICPTHNEDNKENP